LALESEKNEHWQDDGRASIEAMSITDKTSLLSCFEKDIVHFRYWNANRNKL